MDYKKAYDGVMPTSFADNIKPLLGPMNNQSVRVEQNLNNIIDNILVVSSEDRNWDISEANNYTIEFKDTYNFVYSLELVDGFVPSSGYNICSYTNRLDFRVNDRSYTIRLEEGNYIIDTLLQALEKEMHKKSGYRFTCKTNAITRKVTISLHSRSSESSDDSSDDSSDESSDDPNEFELIFTDGREIVGDSSQGTVMETDERTGKKEFKRMDTSVKRNAYITDSIGKVLGFKPVNLSGHHSYVSQMVFNLKPFDYVSLYLNTDKDEDFFIVDSPNDHVSGAFALIYLNSVPESFNTTKYNDRVCDKMIYINYFTPPISFKKLKIEFRAPNGRPYNFNGKEHYLVFRIGRMFENTILRSTNQIMS